MHKTQNINTNPKIVRTDHHECAHVTVMTVLIIFLVILQTVINFEMLSIGGQREYDYEITTCL